MCRQRVRPRQTPDGRVSEDAASGEYLLEAVYARPLQGQKLVLYTRSGVLQGGDGYVSPGQLEECREWARRNDCVVVGEFHDAASGRVKMPPEFRDAVARARGERAALVCQSLDWISRSPLFVFERLKQCRNQGVPVFVVRQRLAPAKLDRDTAPPKSSRSCNPSSKRCTGARDYSHARTGPGVHTMAKTPSTEFKNIFRRWLESLGVPQRRSAASADAYLEILLTQLSAKPVAGQKVILYARSAAAPEEEREARLKGQLQACRAWAESYGCIVVGECAEVASGFAQETPELERALVQAQAEKVALVCISPDRISRSMALFLERQEECRRHGIALFCVR